MSLFLCDGCVPEESVAVVAPPKRWLTLEGSGVPCARCGRAGDSVVMYVRVERSVVCAGCNKEVPLKQAKFCMRCLEIAVCSDACWEKVREDHERVCSGKADVDNEFVGASHEVSSRKAREILRDGTVHGRPLTPAQRRYMGWRAGLKKK